MRSYTIYKLLSPLNEVYIGQTYSITKRFKQYENTKKITAQRLLSKSILDLGWENFKKEILFVGLNKEDADKKEIELISFYKKNAKSLNISKGGDCTQKKTYKTFKVDKNGEILAEYSSVVEAAESNKLDPNLIYNCNKIKSFYAKGMFFIYKELYDNNEFKNRSYIGKWRELRVIQLDLDGTYITTYKSASEASRITGIRRTLIQNCCTNNSNKGGNYLWVYEKNYKPNFNYSYKRRKEYNAKPIITIHKTTGEIKEFVSIQDVVRELGYSKNCISSHCNTNNINNKQERIKHYFKWKK